MLTVTVRPTRLGACRTLHLDTEARYKKLEARANVVDNTAAREFTAAKTSGMMSSTALRETSADSTMIASTNRVQRCVVLEVKSHTHTPIEIYIGHAPHTTASKSDRNSTLIRRESTSLNTTESETASFHTTARFQTRLAFGYLGTMLVRASRVYHEGPAQAEFPFR